MNDKQRSGGNRDHPPPSQRQCDQKNASRNQACPYVTGQMICKWIETRDGVIQQVREEMDRGVIGKVGSKKNVTQIRQRDPFDPRVVSHVTVIVENEKADAK